MLRPSGSLSSTMRSRMRSAPGTTRILSSVPMRPASLTARCLLAPLVALAGALAQAAPPPETAARTIAAALGERRVVVYSATDQSVVGPLLADFAALYPKIEVEYHDMTSSDLHERFLREVAAG